MSIKVIRKKDIATLQVMEDLISNPRHPEDLRKALQELLDSGPTNVIIDLQKVQMVNQSSWGVIASFAKSFRQHGKDIKLVGLQPRLKEHFDQLLHLSDVLEAYQTEEEAMASFSQAVSRIERNLLWNLKS